MKKPKFNINDKVYHVTPESEVGVVLNIRFEYLTGLHEYFVTFSANADTLWYYEHELIDSKQFYS